MSRFRYRTTASAVCALVGAVTFGGQTAFADDAPTAPTVAPTLQGAIATSSATWATVLAGRSDGDDDLFWQVLEYSTTTKRWKLVTPPGVADNGGLVVGAATGSTALVGFGTSQELTFSPLALTDNGGATWAPGAVPTALDVVPSAVALGPDGHALALAAGPDQVVLERSGSLTSWSRLATEGALATVAGARCDLESLSGVSYTADGSPIVAARCARPGVFGLFVKSASSWSFVTHDQGADLTFTPLRVDTRSATLTVSGGGHASIASAWIGADGSSWSISSFLPLKPHEKVVATGSTASGAQFVVVRDGSTTEAEVAAGRGDPWVALKGVPAGTSTIAVEPDGTFAALVVADTKVTVWEYSATSDSWKPVQSITIPINFGSSS